MTGTKNIKLRVSLPQLTLQPLALASAVREPTKTYNCIPTLHADSSEATQPCQHSHACHWPAKQLLQFAITTQAKQHSSTTSPWVAQVSLQPLSPLSLETRTRTSWRTNSTRRSMRTTSTATSSYAAASGTSPSSRTSSRTSSATAPRYGFHRRSWSTI